MKLKQLETVRADEYKCLAAAVMRSVSQMLGILVVGERKCHPQWTGLVVLTVNVHSPLWGLLSHRWSAGVMDVELQYYIVPFVNAIG